MTEPAWEQQLGEPDRWYGRFHHYLLMGTGRSLLGCVHAEEKAAKSPKKLCKTVPGAWKEAAEKWQWKTRAAAWDEMNRQQEEAVWAERRKQVRDKQWELSQQLLNKAEKMLAMPLTRKTLEDGQTVIEPAKWGFRDAATYAQLGTLLGRQAAEVWQEDLNAALMMARRFGFALVDTYEQEGSAPEIREEGFDGERE